MLKDATVRNDIDDPFLKKVLDYILLRIRFTYGYKDMLHYITHCLCLRRINPKDSILHKRHILYKKGVEKLERELDIVNLIRSIR